MLVRLDNVLAVTLICGASDKVGDVVEITADLTCAKVSSLASTKIVGTLVKKLDAASQGWMASTSAQGVAEGAETGETFGTIETRFRARRDDRVSGAACAVGPFVFDAAMKVIAYNAGAHDSSAIAGLCIKHSTAGEQLVTTLEY